MKKGDLFPLSPPLPLSVSIYTYHQPLLTSDPTDPLSSSFDCSVQLMYLPYLCLFSISPSPFSSFSAKLGISRRVPQHDLGPAQGFCLLKGSLTLPLLLVGGSLPRDNCDCNRCDVSKVNWIELFSGLLCVKCNWPLAQTLFHLPGFSPAESPLWVTHPRLTSQQRQSANSNHLIPRRGSFTKMTVSLKRNQGDIWICIWVSWLLVRPATPRRCPSLPASACQDASMRCSWGRRNVSSVHVSNCQLSWMKWADVERIVKKRVQTIHKGV